MLLPTLLLAACTGTASVSIPEPTRDTSANEPAPDQDPLPTGSAVSYGPAEADAGALDADAGALEPGPAPVPVCAAEIEPNDASGAATPFATCLTGTLATTKDKDFGSIVAPAGVTTMLVAHTELGGPVSYRVYPATPLGSLFPTTFTGAAPPIAVEPGTTYFFRLVASGALPAGPRGYEVTVSFE